MLTNPSLGQGPPLGTTDPMLPSVTLQVPPPLSWVLLQGKKQFESYQMRLVSHGCLCMSEYVNGASRTQTPISCLKVWSFFSYVQQELC